MFDRLHSELIRKVYEYDPTYHDLYREVMNELVVNRRLVSAFTHDLDQVIFSPSYRRLMLAQYSKTDLLRLCRFMGIRVSKRTTRRRLIAVLSVFHLSQVDAGQTPAWFYENGNGMWLFL